MFRRKRLVRVHLKDDERSLEGYLQRFPGRYVLRLPKLLESEERSISFDPDVVVEIPTRNVLFWERIR